MSPEIDRFVVSQGIKIHYLAKNMNDRRKASILFVPGVMMPAWIWEKQLDYFSENYRVVAMDTRSQGGSDQASEGHYALSLAKDIKAVVDELELEPLVLVGWSLGVPEVVNYAAHFASSGRLIKLVLVDGLVGIDPTVSFYRSTVDYWMQFQTDRLAKTREFVELIFKQPQSEAYLEKLTETALLTPTNTVMALIDNYLLQDFRPLLPRIDVPTLIATVEGPRLAYMQHMQELIPRSRLEIFESAGHALFVDRPEDFNRVLESFIEER